MRKPSGIAYCEFSAVRAPLSQFLYRRGRTLHNLIVIPPNSGSLQFIRRIVAMPRGKFLADLYAPAMPMHIAEAANIHQNVEAELLARAKCPLHLIVAPAMAQSHINNFVSDRFSRSLNRLANLAIRIMTVLVNQRCRQFDFERFVIEQDRPREPERSATFPISSDATCRNSRRVSIS